MVEPTIGHIVHYWPDETDIARGGMVVLDQDQPFVGLVVHVNAPTIVNLAIIDHVGNMRARSNAWLYSKHYDVTLPAKHSGCWEWPQIKPAAQAAQEAR